LVTLTLFIAVVGCGASQAQTNDGIIAVSPHAPTAAIVTGKTALGFNDERDGFLFVPSDTMSRGVPLMVMLHGATQRARLFERILPLADSMGVAVLAPDSREITWDAIRGTFGPDIAFIQRAIAFAFDHARVDRCRVVIGGFSDGASYALSLGIRNSRGVSRRGRAVTGLRHSRPGAGEDPGLRAARQAGSDPPDRVHIPTPRTHAASSGFRRGL
jgi:poly(3-hydroxybutyrate) depolymerase